jgi:hypothetical protein
VNGVRWAVVQYGPGVLREEWCTEGHSGYVLEGEVNYEFENGDEPLRVSAGHGLLLPDGAGHRGRADESGVRLFLIDRAGWAVANGIVAVDVGETFTDLCVLGRDSGEPRVAKVPSTSGSIEGVLAGLREAEIDPAAAALRVTERTGQRAEGGAATPATCWSSTPVGAW